MQFKYKFKILLFAFLHTIFEFIAFNILWIFKFIFSIILFPMALFSEKHWKTLFGEGFHTEDNFLEKPLINYEYLELAKDTKAEKTETDKEDKDGNN